MLRLEGLTFPGMAPLTCQIHSGEIAYFRDENYTAAARLRECFLGGRNWLSGMLWLNGQAQTHEEMTKADRHGDRDSDRTAGPSRRCIV